MATEKETLLTPWQLNLDMFNEGSWLLKDKKPPFNAIMSAGRFPGVGNTSEVRGPEGLSTEEKVAEADANLARIIRNTYGTDFENVRILRPQEDYSSLVSIDADQLEADPDPKRATWANEQGDFIFTRDPSKIIGVRTADCPTVLAYGSTPEGPILTLTHIPRRGADSNYVSDMLAQYSKLNIDPKSLKIEILGGISPDHYVFNNEAENPLDGRPEKKKLFKITNRQLVDDKFQYSYEVDIMGYVIDELLKAGIERNQMFVDASDTAQNGSGYGSHRMEELTGESPVRNAVLGQMSVDSSLE